MKYIVTKCEEDGVEEIFLFSKRINHNLMAEAIYAIKDGNSQNWKRIRRTPISAGFIEGGKCVGYSETLKLGAREIDTQLL